MYVYVAQDYDGNVYITDEKDALPPDVTDYDRVYLQWKARFTATEDPTLSVDIQDYSEIVSIKRGDDKW